MISYANSKRLKILATKQVILETRKSFILKYLNMHFERNHGEIDEEFRRGNETSLERGIGRVISRFPTNLGMLCVIENLQPINGRKIISLMFEWKIDP